MARQELEIPLAGSSVGGLPPFLPARCAQYLDEGFIISLLLLLLLVFSPLFFLFFFGGGHLTEY